DICFKDIVEDKMRSIENQLDREYVMNEIMSAVDDLPEKQKYVFINNVVEEKTFKELSEETGELINTLIARKRYAVRFLQSRLIEIKKLIDKN
ncbi:sigma-70 family RNA polymerase sigma factor, partial [bacterium]|nr:sigma-70 family RNA polymerase sigma factor [bacterium]